jgi:DNA-binding NarL/FixJ family response regulator
MRIALCDDHEMFRSALATALTAQGGLQVVAQAASGAELLRMLAEMPPPDLLLQDLSLGVDGAQTGIALLEQLARDAPSVWVIVVSMHSDGPTMQKALRAGARAYVGKGSSIDVLLQAIDAVRRGHVFIDPALSPALAQQAMGASHSWDNNLSERERAVMIKVCAGQRLSAIAMELGISVKTVATHKMRLMNKLGIDNNAELIRFGQRQGLS